MKTPTVHLNGTSKEELVKQLQGAYNAVEIAIEALCHAAPHGRDYYPQDDNAISEALKEHKSRVDKLRDVRDELMEIWESTVNNI